MHTTEPLNKKDLDALRRIDAVYCEVLDEAPEDRRARLNELCDGDEELRAAVLELLQASEAPFGEIDGLFAHLRDTYWRSVEEPDPEPAEDLSGQRIGAWRLTGIAGRGGLATVYEAHRDDGEYHQRAAFKVMRRGLDTDDLVLRFRAEREILATLQNPSIARILDGGAMPDGRPYLVMEYVDGDSITAHVRANDLDTNARVALVRDVANAIHHAHQHLFVHRDIKPSNVMVTSEGAVRVLDFGIAKMLDPADGSLPSHLTRTGAHLLTPAYASPEQHQRKPITTAADVYQLGLLLGEVLTGTPPMMTADGVPGPVTRRIPHADLAAIVQKATRLEPEGRYGTAAELADDLDRYLTNRPVNAQPDSAWYRLRKLMKRRPLVVPAIALGMLAVGVYLATVTAYSRQVERERSIAEETKDFLIGLFQSPDPGAPADPERGRRITVVEALDIGQQRTLSNLEDQPELQASLSRSISSVYAALDQFEPAIRLRELALSLEQRLYGADSSQALASMRTLADLKRRAGDLAAAGELSQRQLELARNRKEPGVELGLAEHEAGTHALRVGDDDQAAEMLRSAIDELVADGSVAEKLDAEKIRSILDAAVGGQKTIDGAKQVEQMALQVFGPDTPQGIQARLQVANSLTGLGDYAAAEARYAELVPLVERTYGTLHPTTLGTRANLAQLYIRLDRYADAENIYADLLVKNTETYGLETQAVASTYQNLATVIARQGRHKQALELHARARELFRKVHGPAHYLNALPLLSMAYIHIEDNDPNALEPARDALEILERALPESYMTGIARCLTGKALLVSGDATGTTLLRQAQPLLQDPRVSEPYAGLCRNTE